MSQDNSDQNEWDFPKISRSIRAWFTQGKRDGFRFLLVCQDTFDAYRDSDMGIYPYYALTLADAKAFEAKQLNGGDILMEVLELDKDMETQLSGKCRRQLNDFLS